MHSRMGNAMFHVWETLSPEPLRDGVWKQFFRSLKTQPSEVSSNGLMGPVSVPKGAICYKKSHL